MSRSPLKYNPIIPTATGDNSGTFSDEEFLNIINSNLMDQGVSGQVLGNQQPLYDSSGRMITPQYALDQLDEQRRMFSPGVGEANYGTSTYVAGFGDNQPQIEGQEAQQTSSEVIIRDNLQVPRMPGLQGNPMQGMFSKAVPPLMDSGQVDYK